MKEIAKVHRDGKGVTFLGDGGYIAYRLLRIVTGVRNKTVRWAMVKQRHQCMGTTLEIMMPIDLWKALLDDARGREGAPQ